MAGTLLKVISPHLAARKGYCIMQAQQTSKTILGASYAISWTTHSNNSICDHSNDDDEDDNGERENKERNEE
jgi:hypothetical protein